MVRHPDRSEQSSRSATTSDSFAQRSRYRFQISASNLFSVILTEAEQSARSGRTSDSFAQAKPVPVPSCRIRFLCHPDQSEQSSRSRRTLDSFAPAKPVPVPSLRIQISVILSGSCWSRKISAKRFVRIRSLTSLEMTYMGLSRIG